MSYYTNPHGHQCPWYPYAELLGYPSANWCEETSCFWISEPISTYSSVAFILVASLLFSSLKKKNHPDLKLYLNLLLLTGVGVAIYHLSLNYAAQLLAHGLAYTFLGAVFLKNLMRQGRISYSQRNKALAAHVVFFLILEHILYSQFLATQVLIPVAFLLVLISELMCRKYESEQPSYKFLVGGFIVLLIAEFSSMADLFKIHCNPSSDYFHGHALWHVLAAISFGMLYWHIFQLYPAKAEERKVDLDKFSDEPEEVDIEVDIATEEMDYDATNPSLQFDSVLDLNEEPELDEDEELEDEDAEVQIQFNFDDMTEEDSSLAPQESEVEDEDEDEDEDEQKP